MTTSRGRAAHSQIRDAEDLDALRARIPAAAVIDRLAAHVLGSDRLDSTQVSAALGLLKKALPDYATEAVSARRSGPIEIVWRGEADSQD